MAKKKQDEAQVNTSSWVTTFGDLMNLLLCFFVLLFSMSTTETDKFQEISASLSSSFSIFENGGSSIINEDVLVSSGVSQLNELSNYYSNMGLNSKGEDVQDFEDAYEEVEKAGLEESESMSEYIEGQLQAAGISSQVDVTATSKYVMLKLNGGILFDSGSAELKNDAVSLLNKVASIVKEYDDNIIEIEGHTDNVPITSSKYPDNTMLSLYRAYTVLNYFTNVKGFDKTNIKSSGRGEAVPIASNSTPEGRAQNRRVEIKVYNSFY